MARKRTSKSSGGKGDDSSFWWLVLVAIVGIGILLWWLSPRMKTMPNTGQTNEFKRVTRPGSPATNPIPNIVLTQAPPVVQTSSPAPLRVMSGDFPRPVRDVLEAQIALSQFAISPGSIDGAIGSQTRAAFAAFQKKKDLLSTGELDAATRSELSLLQPPLTNYIISTGDLARLQPVSKTWMGKSRQSALDYETILELVAERGHASPNLVRRLNPGVNWSNVVAGLEISLPNADYPKAATRAAHLVISLGKRQLQAFDADGKLVAHFPCSIAARYDKRPIGELYVTTVAFDPDYTFNPEVFPESAEARQMVGKRILPPGPNNPVGTAWIGLSRPGYGIHGTPSPEQVGRTESHGCFRLANWNATYLARIAWVGLPVKVEL